MESPMNLIVYLRVSSESQMDGYGLDNQEWLCQGQLAPECQRYSAPPVTAGLASGWQSRGSR